MKKAFALFACFFSFLCLGLSSCQPGKTLFQLSQKPAELSQNQQHFPQIPEAETTFTTSAGTGSETLAFTAPKVSSAKVQIISRPAKPMPAQNQANINFKQIPAKTIQSSYSTQEHDPEKIRGRKLSGIFLAAGVILLLVALIFALTGVSAAGLLAWLGGGLVLSGFIFSMVALLGR